MCSAHKLVGLFFVSTLRIVVVGTRLWAVRVRDFYEWSEFVYGKRNIIIIINNIITIISGWPLLADIHLLNTIDSDRTPTLANARNLLILLLLCVCCVFVKPRMAMHLFFSHNSNLWSKSCARQLLTPPKSIPEDTIWQINSSIRRPSPSANRI